MRRTTVVASLAAGALAALTCLPTAAAVPAAAQAQDAYAVRAPWDADQGTRASGTAYTNPTSERIADTYADPAVLRGKDGWWYAYATSDPLHEGELRHHLVPMSRSRDLVSWEYLGDAFTTAPSWAAEGAGIWAPDVRYVSGEYRMYYVITETTVTGERGDNAIGMATAPSPAGPWTDSGGPVVGPRRGAGASNDFRWTFDPAAVTGEDGTQWLFYGSYYGGLWVTRLAADGRTTVGQPTQVAIDNKFEGSYVVQRDGWWYLFASTANCCAGPTTGYSVQVGRSRSVTGPYVDRQGTSLLESRAGGTPTLVQNGNRWIGAGHNAIATDVEGTDWIVYHAIDPSDPFLDGTGGINERPMLMDRLDWVDGWPHVRADQGPSEDAEPGPETDLVGSPRRVGTWAERVHPDAGTVLASQSAGRLEADAPSGADVRVEADLASGGASYGLAAGTRGAGEVRLVVSPTDGQARLEHVRGAAVVRTASAALPGRSSGVDTSELHAVTLEVRGDRAVAQLTHARLGDPFVSIELSLAGRFQPATGGAVAGGPGVAATNLSVAAQQPRPELVRDDVPGTLDAAASEEFEDGTLGVGWRWVRQDPAAKVEAGSLVWPTQAADLVGPSNTAGLLLRDPGAGDWTVEAKVRLDVGTDTVRNFQQAGLVVRASDDDFARLSHVAIWNTRQTEFGRERPYAGRLAFGGTIVGPPAETTWLRLSRSTGDEGRQLVRAWTSRDGSDWVKGGVWTFAGDQELDVGVLSHGGAGATAQFDHVRIFR